MPRQKMTKGRRDELLRALHHGPFDRPLWHGFLEQLTADLDLNYTSLILRRSRTERNVLAEFSAGRVDMAPYRALYRASLGRLDPLSYDKLEEGCSYNIRELLPPDQLMDHPFYKEFLRPAGIARMLIARFSEQSGYHAWLSLCRDESQEDFSRSERSLFDWILPHMQVALHAFAVVERHKVLSSITRHFSERLDLAAITLTSRAEILGMGPGASAVAARSGVIVVGSDNRLRLQGVAAQRRFREALRNVIAGNISKAILIRANGQTLELLVTQFLSTTTYGTARPDAVVYLHLQGHAAGPSDIRRGLREMFGLTQLECDITLGFTRGQNIAEIAVDLDLAESTVRSYTKSIYPKLNVRRQADLVRIVLQSLAILA